MAVVVEAFVVVVRERDVEDHYPGGVAGFRAAIPNATFCSDGALCRAGFMRDVDRAAFVEHIARHGIDVGLVDRDAGIESGTDWLEIGRYAGALAVWLAGTDPEPLVAPLSWRPNNTLTQMTSEQIAEHLEHIGDEGNLEVYRDRRTGGTVYTARTRPVLDDAAVARLEELRQRGSELVWDLLPLDGAPPKRPGMLGSRKLRKGIGMLEQVVAELPDHWPTWFLLGLSRRALLEHDRALDAFRMAYTISPEHKDLGREYAGQCMIVGDGTTAVRIAREVSERFPDDADLLSNFAVALLIGGDLDEAEVVARAALKRQPDDAITAAVLDYILDVKAGKRPRPKSMPGY